MSPSTHTAAALALVAALATTAAFAAAPNEQRAQPSTRIPKVQIALLLDNSGSMNGLLNQARVQMWSVVNTFAHAKQQGRPIRLEIALYDYGDGVKRLSHFTTDLDLISEHLFGLGIRGGAEHCGEVIDTAVRELEWSGDPEDLKLIYIAGNEPFTQGPVDFREAIAQAKQKHITVNTIHCGGDDASWREGAKVAQGNYFMINHNAAVAQVVAPQDAELARLSRELNDTYLGYGASGREAKQRQKKMDVASAQAAPAAAAERAVAKAGRGYSNAEWDLVDAVQDGKVKVEALEEAQLPAQMKGMNAEQRKAFVAQNLKKRAEIKKRIQELSAARTRFLDEARKQQGSNDATLDSAMSRSIREQGEKKAFSF